MPHVPSALFSQKQLPRSVACETVWNGEGQKSVVLQCNSVTMQVVTRLGRREEFRYFITARPSRFRVHATYVTVIDRQVSTAVRSA